MSCRNGNCTCKGDACGVLGWHRSPGSGGNEIMVHKNESSSGATVKGVVVGRHRKIKRASHSEKSM